MASYEVGFLGHLESPNDYLQFLKGLNPDLEDRMRSDAQLQDILSTLRPTPISEIMLRSANGEVRAGLYVDLFILAHEQFKHKAAINRVVKGCRLLDNAGCKITALGGFSSIIAEIGKLRNSHEFSAALTTGNTMTAATIAQQVCGIAGPADTVTVVGAAGDVGSGICRMLHKRGYRLNLVGRSHTKLAAIGNDLDGCRIADWNTVARHTDVAVLIASAAHGEIELERLPQGATVLDGGHPRNSHPSQHIRYAVAGRVAHYHAVETEIQTIMDTFNGDGETHACLGEAIVLGYERIWEPYSQGSGHIFPDKMSQIMDLGEKHGVTASKLRFL